MNGRKNNIWKKKHEWEKEQKHLRRKLPKYVCKMKELIRGKVKN